MYWSSSKRSSQQNALFQDARLHVRVADGAEEMASKLAQLLQRAESGSVSPVRR